MTFLDSLTGQASQVTLPILPAEAAETPRPSAEVLPQWTRSRLPRPIGGGGGNLDGVSPAAPLDTRRRIHERTDPMDINADFTARALVHAGGLDWIPSPMPGVDRRMLDRIGDEVARATSIVRYAPDSRFSAHTHGGGEEFIVLDGTFQDEHGDYPTGTYVRNPPTSSHTPGAEDGCVIFVKLWQFDPDDRNHVRISMDDAPAMPDGPGVTAASLFEDARETVRIETWEPAARVTRDLPGGGEFLVLAGGFGESGDDLHALSWLRLPPGARLDAMTGPQGARVWTKTGHLTDVRAPAP